MISSWDTPYDPPSTGLRTQQIIEYPLSNLAQASSHVGNLPYLRLHCPNPPVTMTFCGRTWYILAALWATMPNPPDRKTASYNPQKRLPEFTVHCCAVRYFEFAASRSRGGVCQSSPEPTNTCECIEVLQHLSSPGLTGATTPQNATPQNRQHHAIRKLFTPRV